MNPAEETAYLQGHRAVWKNILCQALRELGYDDPAAQAARWIPEREAAIQSLRSLCRAKGDNDWDETLHLQDIIEKHLADHLLK
jgi:predicted secreted protein